jgi:FemAB-related protein (PEP-CTERM system-associated)
MCAGAVADHPSIELKLMQAVNVYADGEGIDHIEYRDTISHPDFPVRTDKVNMVLQLPGSPDKLWERFTPKLRSQIRRPQRENPQISFGRFEHLDDFYAVYARNMRDLGSPVHSKKLIRNILQSFPESSWIVVIHLGNEPVGGGLLLHHANKIDIPLASTIRDFNPIGINMLMYWEILKFSVSKGCTQFDFGRSSKDSGTYRFKQQWGAEPHQLYVHYWLKSGNEMPSLNPSNPKYAAAINIWKHLPVSLTKWIGPPIVKALP